MSVLPLDMDDVLTSFDTPNTVQVYDRTGSRGATGTWDYTVGATRNIDAVVLQMSMQELMILTEGDVSGGGIILHTKETLYFQTPNTAGIEDRQSFVLYQGFTFRVVATGFQSQNANFNTYKAIRFISNGVSGN